MASTIQKQFGYRVQTVFVSCPTDKSIAIVTCPTIAGYTPIGVIGMTASGNYNAGSDIYHYVVANGKLYVGWNNTTLSSSFGATFYVLYIYTG